MNITVVVVGWWLFFSGGGRRLGGDGKSVLVISENNLQMNVCGCSQCTQNSVSSFTSLADSPPQTLDIGILFYVIAWVTKIFISPKSLIPSAYV